MLRSLFKNLFMIFFSLNLTICLSQEIDIKLIKDRIYQVLISNDSNLSFPYTFTTDEELDKVLNEFDGEFDEDEIRLYRLKFLSEVAN